MATAAEKVGQYLGEAHATKLASVRAIQAHVAVAPRGEYRSALERHLRESRKHADRLQDRLSDLDEDGRGIVEASVGAVQGIVGQALAVGKTPLDLVRGESGEEKLLKNAKDDATAEQLEIATYVALEALAQHVGDDRTAKLAGDIRTDEEQMLEELHRLIPVLTVAAARSEIVEPSFRVSETGAADAARSAAETGVRQADTIRRRVRDTTRRAIEQVTEAAQRAVQQIADVVDRGEDTAEATARVALDNFRDTAQQAEDAVRQVADSTREEAGEAVEAVREGAKETAKTARAEGRGTARSAQRGAAQTRRTARSGGGGGGGRGSTANRRRGGGGGSGGGGGNEPWSGYSEQKVAEINQRLKDADPDLAKRVRDYERANKARSTILAQAERKAT